MDNELLKLELIHLGCGFFNGSAVCKLNNKLFKFELATPESNDFNEYRVRHDSEFKRWSKWRTADYVLDVPPSFNASVQLTEKQANWWLNKKNPELLSYKEAKGEGYENKELFLTIERPDERCTIEPFDEWIKKPQSESDFVMFSVLKFFFEWMYGQEGKPIQRAGFPNWD